MSDLVDRGAIEDLVGYPRHTVMHIGRAVTAEQRVYILHPEVCLARGGDLRDCRFSRALDRGIDIDGRWAGNADTPVVLAISPQGGQLVPTMRLEPQV